MNSQILVEVQILTNSTVTFSICTHTWRSRFCITESKFPDATNRCAAAKVLFRERQWLKWTKIYVRLCKGEVRNELTVHLSLCCLLLPVSAADKVSCPSQVLKQPERFGCFDRFNSRSTVGFDFVLICSIEWTQMNWPFINVIFRRRYRLRAWWWIYLNVGSILPSLSQFLPCFSVSKVRLTNEGSYL